MKKISVSLVALAGLSLIAGCATTTSPVADRTLDNDPALKTIEEAVRHIEKQNAMLAQIERQKNPLPAPSAKPSAEEFERLVYLRNWNGSAMKAINRVAEAMGYRTEISGTVPAIEPTVSLDANGVPAYDVLRDISDQGQRQFDLRVDIDRKLINVAFNPKRG